MREIKFRGKRKDNKEMIYGDLCFYDDIAFIGVAKSITEIREDVFVPTIVWYEVIPESIGQFTGLKDRNEKEIYDGDIVHCKMGKYCEVTNRIFFLEGSFCLYDLGNFGAEHAKNSEVIGNIYENPELIK